MSQGSSSNTPYGANLRSVATHFRERHWGVMICPMRHTNGVGLADRLSAAMAEAGLSNRGLAVKMAGGTRDKDRIERYRRQVRRILSGEQKTVQRTTAALLAEVLRTPVDYWPTERAAAKSPLEAAELLIRRLDAGEDVRPETRYDVALQLEETAALCGRLAVRLRAGVAGERSGP